MNIALVSEHASPLADIGGVDAGGQNVHVAALAQALARTGHNVTVYTRRDSRELPRCVPLGCGVVVEHVDAGPPVSIAKDDLLPWMGAFAADLFAAWQKNPPDVAHSHFWTSGKAALSAARPLCIPVVHTFHALGAEKRRHQGASDSSPLQRIDEERVILAGSSPSATRPSRRVPPERNGAQLSTRSCAGAECCRTPAFPPTPVISSWMFG